MKIVVFTILSSLLVFTSCKSDSIANTDESSSQVSLPSDIEEIEVLFDHQGFSDSIMPRLLKEINICQEDTVHRAQGAIPCSADYFKFFPLADNMKLDNGFILLIKANAGGFPLRRVLVFQRERGELIKLNGFVANIIGRVKSKTGYNDLILRFRDKDGEEDMFYNCLFKWNGSSFEYKQVDVIEGKGWGGKVKAQFKDSISLEIYQNIMRNKMIF
jgi:hypothetical protein